MLYRNCKRIFKFPLIIFLSIQRYMCVTLSEIYVCYFIEPTLYSEIYVCYFIEPTLYSEIYVCYFIEPRLYSEIYVCYFIEPRLYSAALSRVHHELNTAYTGKFDNFTHTYLCTRQTCKWFKGTVVNRVFPCLHGGSLEIKLTDLSRINVDKIYLIKWLKMNISKMIKHIR